MSLHVIIIKAPDLMDVVGQLVEFLRGVIVYPGSNVTSTWVIGVGGSLAVFAQKVSALLA
jgi:hypothetical protein